MTRPPIARAIVVALVAVPLSWFCFAMSMSLSLSRSNPAAAVRLWSNNSLAQAALADALVSRGIPAKETIQSPRRHAIAALSSQPGNEIAARVLGITTAIGGDNSGLDRWLHYAERYSRRDLGTQLAFIELAVNKGDVTEALTHYDRALRVFAPQPDLVSILVTATQTPAVRHQLAVLLQTRPPWRGGYLIQLVEGGHAPAATIYEMLRDLKLNSGDPFERRILSEAVVVLVNQDRLELARNLIGARQDGIRNGSFDESNFFPPLDWKLAGDADLSAVIEQGVRERGGNAMFLEAHNNASGVVAEQRLALRRGRYQVTLVTGDGPEMRDAAPVLSIACVGAKDTLTTIPLLSGNRNRRLASPAFSIPVDCLSQRLTISVPASEGTIEQRPWIDDVVLAKF